MQAIRIRQPFAGLYIIATAAYLGLSTQKIPQYGQSDKGLHFITFFLLTITFYWILETSRRRVINLTLIVCTAGLSIGSELVKAFLPYGRDFDPFDVLANVVGSALALGLSSWYHKRMLERKRKNKHYDIVPGGEGGEDELGRDVELGEAAGEHSLSEQETGKVDVKGAGQADGGAKPNVTEELDNWDENEEDNWDEDPSQVTPGSSEAGGETKRRAD
ncbi:VanZ domain-containing protein [Teratosphaeria destructans]|uniref:VanZ domain-containing protein n=1 Tax=Teratosphaeria destructans TaxID=418781 RepID=A0A9W7SKS5_9PEZI|nr:VanZ domain-containing protein [Teratosphaeria destructans]